MILFFISFCLCLLSSYLLTSVFAPPKKSIGALYLIIIGFAQIIFTFEFLSLFNAISEIGVLTLNSITTLISYYVWTKSAKPIWWPDFSQSWAKLINALKLDKSLIFLSVGFLFFIAVTIFLCAISPANSADGYAYHVVRSLFWIESGNLDHFGISDIRALCMPINSEILYAWVFLFLKKDLGLPFFGFCGYLLTMISLFNILGLMGYCLRKKLWVIFILSSFSGVIGQASGLETDIIIAGLILACINLFWYGIIDAKAGQNYKKTPIFFAALAYALAIGVKTTALLAIPAVGIFLVFLGYKYRAKNLFKPILIFLGFGLLNFILFSSYNYILNFINYGNLIGTNAIIEGHRNIYGVRAIVANFIKYIFLFFDFSSFRWSDYVGEWILQCRSSILDGLGLGGIKDGVYTIQKLTLNNKLIDIYMLGGILGFLIYLPAWVLSGFKFNLKSTKKMTIFMFGLILLINILVMSYNLAFMSYSVRFLLCFAIISSPILLLSYFKSGNLLKYIIIFFALSNMFLITTHLAARPFFKAIRIISQTSITKYREILHCKGIFNPDQFTNEMCAVSDTLERKYQNNKHIIVFIDTAEYTYMLKRLMFKGFQVDFGNLENADNIDFKKYDLAIIAGNKQKSTVIGNFENRVKLYTIKDNALIFDTKYLAPCVYFNNRREIITNNSGQSPFLSECYVTSFFLDTNKFKLLEVIDFPNQTERENKIYNIYKLN